MDNLKYSQMIMKNIIPIPEDEPVNYIDSKTLKDTSVQKRFYVWGLHKKQGQFSRDIDDIIVKIDQYFKHGSRYNSKCATKEHHESLKQKIVFFKIQMWDTNKNTQNFCLFFECQIKPKTEYIIE